MRRKRKGKDGDIADYNGFDIDDDNYGDTDGIRMRTLITIQFIAITCKKGVFVTRYLV